MATITVRKLEEDMVTALKLRAARRGVSMEEEIRSILREVISDSGAEKVGSRMEDIFRKTWSGERFSVLDGPLPHRPPPFFEE